MTSEVDDLAAMVQAAGIAWWIESDREARLQQLVAEARAIDAILAHRFAGAASESVLDHMLREPVGLRPLIQSFGSPMSCTARALIYCILTGASIRAISYEYEAQAKSSLRVDVRARGGESTFEMEDVWDFEVLRHLGTAKLSGRPLVDGYYAFRS